MVKAKQVVEEHGAGQCQGSECHKWMRGTIQSDAGGL
jgi:hypothetical protein